jgi:hypothetical protein
MQWNLKGTKICLNFHYCVELLWLSSYKRIQNTNGTTLGRRCGWWYDGSLQGDINKYGATLVN